MSATVYRWMTVGARRTWKYRLAYEIARQNQCNLYSCRGICLIGRPSDATAVRYLFAWLSREIERLAKEQCAGYGRFYHNNFRIGAAETVAKRLREQKEAARQVYVSGRGSSYRGNATAREAGRAAGYSVRMAPSGGSLSSGARSLTR